MASILLHGEYAHFKNSFNREPASNLVMFIRKMEIWIYKHITW